MKNNKDFEYFLMEKHAEDYQGIDDDMVDAFNDWLVELQVDEIIEYANQYIAQIRKELKSN